MIFIDEICSGKEASINNDARNIYDKLSKPEDILNITFKGVVIGEQIYDTILKYKNATVWTINDKIIPHIKNAIKAYYVIDYLNIIYDLKAALFTHSTCVYHGVYTRYILSKKIPVFMNMGGLGAINRINRTLNANSQLKSILHIEPEVFQRLINNLGQANILVKAKVYYQKRFCGDDKNDFDAVEAFSKDKILFKNKESFCAKYNLNSSYPIVFIMLHAMTDDPHFVEQNIFKDYYDWFYKTLEIVREVKKVNWVFKQHPLIRYYPDDANVPGMIKILNQPNIIYLSESENISTASIPNLANAIVTCAGTSALEFIPCGIPGIVGCKNDYTGHGLCIEPDNFEEYKNVLQKIASQSKPTKLQKEKALLLFYLLYSVIRPAYVKGLLPFMSIEEMRNINNTKIISLMLESLTGPRINKLRKDIIPLMEFIKSKPDLSKSNEIYFAERLLDKINFER